MNKTEGVRKHFIKKIQDRTFDEYDIMSFLILARNENLKSKYPIIYDFANIVAHRVRTEGRAHRAMSRAIQNNFRLTAKGTVKGFDGVSYDSLVTESKKLFGFYGIEHENKMIREFILCLMSIAQHTICEVKVKDEGKDIICTIEVFHSSTNQLSLITVGKTASICYLKCPFNFPLQNSYPFGHIKDAIEMVRIDGSLTARFCETGELI